MFKKFLHALVFAVLITIILGAFFHLKIFDNWQLRLSDTLYTTRQPLPDIAIIAIDDSSIQSVGRWPWDRSVHAQLLNKIASEAAVIGFDVSFPEPSKDKTADAKLATALKTAGNVVLPVTAAQLRQVNGAIAVENELAPIPEFAAVSGSGMVNMFTDIDNTTRETPIVIQAADHRIIENFSVAILKKYLHIQTLPAIPSDAGLLRINYVGKPGTFPIFSYVDVLNGKIDPAIFKNKILLVGATALDLHDTVSTPESFGAAMSGVEVHANILQTILDHKFLRLETELNTITTIFALSFITSVIFVLCGLLPNTIGLFLFFFLYVVYTIYSFDKGVIRNLIYPLLTIAISYITFIVYKYFGESAQKRFIKKALSLYLSDSVMHDVLSDPKKLKLGGTRRMVTVLFSDVAGFTTISEKLPPEKLAHLLNSYLTRMTKIVFDNAGVLDKYIGDAVMAFWGAPLDQKDHALLACRTAIKMSEEIQIIKKDWAEAGINNFDARIGINSGDMIVGNMGSDLRFDYTLLGDNVNLGSRLEGINKEYETNIIISGATYEFVKNEVIARQVDIVAVKGKALGVPIFELRGLGIAVGPEKDFLDTFEVARSLYHEGQFKKALTSFKELAKKYPDDYCIRLYVERCQEYAKVAPKNWDGVFHAKSK
jgi:adenylate cyclase